jgi:aspartate-semialdehyde dehydrogenase
MVARKKKIPVAILGATGVVGQRFVNLLSDHPWFEIAALASSEKRVSHRYGDVCQWHLPDGMPSEAADMVVQSLEPTLSAKIVFSALPSSIARKIEPEFAQAGYLVCSNASAFRQEPDVPLVIPEVNYSHLALIKRQKRERGWKGLIITSPNCTTTGIVIPLKVLDQAFGLRKVFSVSMQAVSGAGYPGLPYLDIEGNVIPYIGGEEEKIELETRLLLGVVQDEKRIESDVMISVQSNRVPVVDGHTSCLSVELEKKPTIEEACRVLAEFSGPSLKQSLPSGPEHPIVVREEKDRPQPRKDCNAGNGMIVSVGRVRPCSILDLRMVTLVHNTLRGAASGAILNAELLVSEGYIN